MLVTAAAAVTNPKKHYHPARRRIVTTTTAATAIVSKAYYSIGKEFLAAPIFAPPANGHDPSLERLH